MSSSISICRRQGDAMLVTENPPCPFRDKVLANSELLHAIRRFLFVADVKRLLLVSKEWHMFWSPFLVDELPAQVGICRDRNSMMNKALQHHGSGVRALTIDWHRTESHLPISQYFIGPGSCRLEALDFRGRWRDLPRLTEEYPNLKHLRLWLDSQHNLPLLQPTFIAKATPSNPSNVQSPEGPSYPTVFEFLETISSQVPFLQNEANMHVNPTRDEGPFTTLRLLSSFKHLHSLTLTWPICNMGLLLVLKHNPNLIRLCILSIQHDTARRFRAQLVVDTTPIPPEFEGIEQEETPSWTNSSVRDLEISFGSLMCTPVRFVQTSSFVHPDLRVVFSRLNSIRKLKLFTPVDEEISDETWAYICRTSLTQLQHLHSVERDMPTRRMQCLLRWAPNLKTVYHAWGSTFAPFNSKCLFQYARIMVTLDLQGSQIHDKQLTELAEHPELRQSLQHLNISSCTFISLKGFLAVVEGFQQLRALSAQNMRMISTPQVLLSSSNMSTTTYHHSWVMKPWACASTMRFFAYSRDRTLPTCDKRLHFKTVLLMRRRLASLTALETLSLWCEFCDLSLLDDWTLENQAHLECMLAKDTKSTADDDKSGTYAYRTPLPSSLLGRLACLDARFGSIDGRAGLRGFWDYLQHPAATAPVLAATAPVPAAAAVVAVEPPTLSQLESMPQAQAQAETQTVQPMPHSHPQPHSSRPEPFDTVAWTSKLSPELQNRYKVVQRENGFMTVSSVYGQYDEHLYKKLEILEEMRELGINWVFV
ncbi:hypothetical protein BGZ73_001082 [Actinomortierella ambigua]|nr:hypothetical protein BGZ73_001082 [Actinomortierella ambigua]